MLLGEHAPQRFSTRLPSFPCAFHEAKQSRLASRDPAARAYGFGLRGFTSRKAELRLFGIRRGRLGNHRSTARVRQLRSAQRERAGAKPPGEGSQVRANGDPRQERATSAPPRKQARVAAGGTGWATRLPPAFQICPFDAKTTHRALACHVRIFFAATCILLSPFSRAGAP